MATIILNHKVADYKTWLPYFEADLPRRKAAGLRDIKVSGKADDPNHVYMILETDDPESFKKMSNDPGLAEVMKKAGVISEPEVVILR
jgi:hypothetical protein